MICGDTSRFAIEHSVTTALSRISQRAIGYFAVHIDGYCYGVRSPTASALGCSFDAVVGRLSERGKHTAPFAETADASELAFATRHALYAKDQEEKTYLGIRQPSFVTMIRERSLLWIPDGDEAFDDGSFVLQFDVRNQVRLVSFKSTEGYRVNDGSLRNLWIPEEEFYGVLKQWRDLFEQEWNLANRQ